MGKGDMELFYLYQVYNWCDAVTNTLLAGWYLETYDMA